jgi:ubiquinone/menaquinone biosynthesis C-methylase UbiE
MNYDFEFWKKYSENEMYNEEFAKFIRDLAISLKANSVLEIGCNIGNDLRLLPETMKVYGVDLNEWALEKAKNSLPAFEFKKGSITSIPYEDSSIDFVFTHNVLNYVPESDMTKSTCELFRVSRKYILNCELFSEGEETIKGILTGCWYRNMYKRWLDFKVKIISDVQMHEDIEPKKPHFTLVRKI